MTKPLLFLVRMERSHPVYGLFLTLDGLSETWILGLRELAGAGATVIHVETELVTRNW